jgi:uncharacterized membrane protein YeiB
MKKPSSPPSPRLASLDILRGFDLLPAGIVDIGTSAQPPMAEQYPFPVRS